MKGECLPQYLRTYDLYIYWSIKISKESLYRATEDELCFFRLNTESYDGSVMSCRCPIKLRIQNVAWRWTKGQAGQNQMTEASDGGTGRDESLYLVTHMPTKTRGKIKLLGTLCSSRLGWFSNRTGTSVNDGARKSDNWLDQWLSGKLGTGSRSSLVLSARFAVVKWRSRSVAKSALERLRVTFTKGQAGQNQMTKASDEGSGRDESLYWVKHMPTKTRGKIKLIGTLCSSRD